MLTAKEARILVGETVNEKVEKILVKVAELAKAKQTKLRCGYDYDIDEELWMYGGYNQTEDWKKAVSILKGLGYKVSFFYEERQFVDMYTLIEW